MLAELQPIPLTDNRSENRFELILEGGTAFLNYQDHGDLFYLMHTEVPTGLEGMGVASALAEKVFDFLGQKQVKIKIYCSYIITWLKRHPEYEGHLA